MNATKSIIFALALVAVMARAQSRDINVPAPNAPFITVNGVGTQNYTCINKNWTFQNPNADLFHNGVKVGTHFFNPTTDALGGKIVFVINGSTVVTKPLRTIPSASPNSIPQVLLQVTQADTGFLNKSAFAQRANTRNGVAPTSPCTDGQIQRVPYTTEYIFYRNPAEFLSAPPAQPQDINVPAPNAPFITVNGVGTQNYACINKNWTFQNPNADLFHNGVKVGTHFFNPTMDALGGKIVFVINGSTVVTKPLRTIPSASPNSIPQVLLQVTQADTGFLIKSSFAQRANTRNGVAPTSPCTDGQIQRVPYTTEYIFYRNPGELPNLNKYTGAFLGIPPARVVQISGFLKPYMVVSANGEVVGTFGDLGEAIMESCNDQFDDCVIGTDTTFGRSEDVTISSCIMQSMQCRASG